MWMKGIKFPVHSVKITMLCLHHNQEKQLKQTTMFTNEEVHYILMLVLHHPLINLLLNTTFNLPPNSYHRHGFSTICLLVISVKTHATGTWKRMPQGMPLGTASPIRFLCPCVSPPTQPQLLADRVTGYPSAGRKWLYWVVHKRK